MSPTIPDGAAGPSGTLSNATATIAAYIGGVQATVTYAGLAPQLAGLYQINLTVPTGVTAGDNNLDIAGPDAYSSECLIAIGAAASDAVSDAASPSTSAAPRHRSVPRVLSRRTPKAPEFR